MGRKSTGQYPENWQEIADIVKGQAGWKCVRCGHDHDIKGGYMLTVHHLDLNKSNCAWWNIPALCQRCHLKIQGKVVMERTWMLKHSPWFVPYVSGYYAAMIARLYYLSVPTDYFESLECFSPEWLAENSEAFIAYGIGQSTMPSKQILQAVC